MKTTVFCTLALIISAPCLAEDTQGGAPPSGGTATEVLSGLAGPVGLEFAQDGKMWISYAGPGSAPGAGGLGYFYTFGTPSVTDVITSYPTSCNPSTGECSGAWHITLNEQSSNPLQDTILLAAGGPPLPELARIKVYNISDGVLEGTSDTSPSGALMASEQTINVFSVLPNALDTNLYSVAFDVNNGRFLIVDAGANAILAYDINGLSVFAELDNVANGVESVPTRIISIPNDGAAGSLAFIVTELTGGPFTAGSATMWGFTNDGTKTALATGLTTVVDCEYEADTNSVLFCSAGSFDFSSGIFAPFTGSIGRVDLASGASETLLDNLWMPAGIEKVDDEIYFTTFYAGGVFKFTPGGCANPDINGDGVVDGQDLAALLAAWTS